MNVLHIGINSIPNLAIARAFRERGHDVISIDWKDRKQTGAALKSMTPDLLFMQLQGPDLVDGNLVRAMRDRGTFVVNWTGDVRHPLPQHYIDMAANVNVTAFTNMPDVEEMQALGFDARFLQVGYDELIYRPDGPVKATPPIVFMGNNYGTRFPLSEARAEMVEAMRREFGPDFAVYGKGWGNSRRVHPDEEAAIYRGTKVAINFDHYDRPGFFSDRYLRSRACGCLTLNATTHSFAQIIADATYWMRSEYRRPTAEKEAAETYANDRWHNRIDTLEQWATTARPTNTK